jgi:hypothetical protein
VDRPIDVPTDISSNVLVVDAVAIDCPRVEGITGAMGTDVEQFTTVIRFCIQVILHFVYDDTVRIAARVFSLVVSLEDLPCEIIVHALEVVGVDISDGVLDPAIGHLDALFAVFTAAVAETLSTRRTIPARILRLDHHEVAVTTVGVGVPGDDVDAVATATVVPRTDHLVPVLVLEVVGCDLVFDVLATLRAALAPPPLDGCVPVVVVAPEPLSRAPGVIDLYVDRRIGLREPPDDSWQRPTVVGVVRVEVAFRVGEVGVASANRNLAGVVAGRIEVLRQVVLVQVAGLVVVCDPAEGSVRFRSAPRSSRRSRR